MNIGSRWLYRVKVFQKESLKIYIQNAFLKFTYIGTLKQNVTI